MRIYDKGGMYRLDCYEYGFIGYAFAENLRLKCMSDIYNASEQELRSLCCIVLNTAPPQPFLNRKQG